MRRTRCTQQPLKPHITRLSAEETVSFDGMKLWLKIVSKSFIPANGLYVPVSNY